MSNDRDPVSNQLKDFANTVQKAPVLTTSNGAPVDSLTASMTTGPRGDIVLKDFTFLDHMAAFDRERIPERVVHAKGGGAFGYFEVIDSSFSQYCRAKLFSTVGKRTPVAVRFSTVGGENGSADTVRDPRGFAVKFYTEEGNWDLVGNNTPIFFIRDPILFPSFIHTQKRNPATHCKDPDMVWDFFSLRPESTHQVCFLFSDRGIPDGFRHMDGFGSHTFKVVNAQREAVYVKWHWKTDQGIRNLCPNEAERISASDPDYALRDLYNAIASGSPPSWTLYVQIMSFAQAQAVPFNPFDVTKVWPHGDFPLQPVGRMVLDRNPAHYFKEIEQIAFSPAHMIPGIEPSPDKMLQGRLFSYSDTHRHRLGPNYQSLPVNCPYAQTVSTYQQDGPMRLSPLSSPTPPNYFPNSFRGPQPQPNATWHLQGAQTGDVQRVETAHDDNFTQCAVFVRNVLDASARDRLATNIAASLSGAQDFIQERALANFNAVDGNFGRAIGEKLREAKQRAEEMKREARERERRNPPAKLNPPREVPPPRSRL